MSLLVYLLVGLSCVTAHSLSNKQIEAGEETSVFTSGCAFAGCPPHCTLEPYLNCSTCVCDKGLNARKKEIQTLLRHQLLHQPKLCPQTVCYDGCKVLKDDNGCFECFCNHHEGVSGRVLNTEQRKKTYLPATQRIKFKRMIGVKRGFPTPSVERDLKFKRMMGVKRGFSTPSDKRDSKFNSMKSGKQSNSTTFAEQESSAVSKFVNRKELKNSAYSEGKKEVQSVESESVFTSGCAFAGCPPHCTLEPYLNCSTCVCNEEPKAGKKEIKTLLRHQLLHQPKLCPQTVCYDGCKVLKDDNGCFECFCNHHEGVSGRVLNTEQRKKTYLPATQRIKFKRMIGVKRGFPTPSVERDLKFKRMMGVKRGFSTPSDKRDSKFNSMKSGKQSNSTTFAEQESSAVSKFVNRKELKNSGDHKTVDFCTPSCGVYCSKYKVADKGCRLCECVETIADVVKDDVSEAEDSNNVKLSQ